jgi:hypothetical protein
VFPLTEGKDNRWDGVEYGLLDCPPPPPQFSSCSCLEMNTTMRGVGDLASSFIQPERCVSAVGASNPQLTVAVFGENMATYGV